MIEVFVNVEVPFLGLAQEVAGAAFDIALV